MIGPEPSGSVIAILAPPSGRIILLDMQTQQVIADTAIVPISLSITRWGCVSPGALVADIYDGSGHRRHWIKSVRTA